MLEPPPAPVTLSKFSAISRTGNIGTARALALSHDCVVGFCPFDGLYYIVSVDEFRAGPFVHGSLPLPKARPA